MKKARYLKAKMPKAIYSLNEFQKGCEKVAKIIGGDMSQIRSCYLVSTRIEYTLHNGIVFLAYIAGYGHSREFKTPQEVYDYFLNRHKEQESVVKDAVVLPF